MTHRLCSSVITYIADPAIRALILAGIVGLLLSVVRVKEVSARLSCWTVVLYAALAMPLLGLVLPSLTVPIKTVPIKGVPSTTVTTSSSPATAEVGSAALYANPSVATDKTIRTTDVSVPEPLAAATVQPVPKGQAAARFDLPWQPLAVALYLLVTVLFLSRFVAGLAATAGIRRDAAPVRDQDALFRLRSLASELGLRTQPGLYESWPIMVPVTVGVLHPRILLPGNWRNWDDTKFTAVLAHELSHVARHDALTQLLSSLHRSLFWFSPLAWILHRHIVELAEQASDDHAVRRVGDPDYYAEIVLSFFDAARKAGGRTRLAGVCMAQGSRAERRIDRILSGTLRSSTSLRRSSAVALTVLVLSLACLAAAVSPSSRTTPPCSGDCPASYHPQTGNPVVPSSIAPSFAALAENGDDLEQNKTPDGRAVVPTPPPDVPTAPVAPQCAPVPAPFVALGVPPAPAAPPTPFAAPSAPTPAPSAAPPTEPVIAPAQPAPVALPSGPTPPPPAPCPAAYPQKASSSRPCSSATTTIVNTGGEKDEAFVIMFGNTTWASGSEQDLNHARSLRRTMKGDYIWFREGSKAYVITDPATIKGAVDLYQPMLDFGKQQSELGQKQAELARQQAEVSARQAHIAGMAPDASARMRHLKIEMELARQRGTVGQAASSVSPEIARKTEERIAQLESELAQMEGEFAKAQQRLERGQSDLAASQGRLAKL